MKREKWESNFDNCKIDSNPNCQFKKRKIFYSAKRDILLGRHLILLFYESLYGDAKN